MRRMVNIVRTRRNSTDGSPKTAEVGEIDTKAPFQSVRAAVSLFGEASSPKASKPVVVTKKSKSQAEDVLDKEATFHIALNELNKLKEQLRGAESARAETLPELDKAKITLDELREKLRLVNESKRSILEASEALNSKAEKLQELAVDSQKPDTESKKEEYRATIKELDAAKQELSNLRGEIGATCEAKLRAIRKSQQAELAADAHRHRVNELSKQAAAMQKGLAKIKASSNEAVERHDKFLAKKDEELQSYRTAKEELERKLLAVKEEHQSLLADDLDLKLTEANAQIATLQEEVKNARAAFLEAQKATSFELEITKGSLKQVEEEKASLQNSLESLKQELEQFGKELVEQKRKEEEVEAMCNRIRSEIEDKKNELESCLVNQASATDASDDMFSSLQQLTMETQKAKQEADDLKKKTEEQMQLAKTTQEMAIEMENKLPDVLKQVEEAKALEISAQGEIKNLSQRSDLDSTSSTSEGNGKVKVSKEEYNSLMEKVNESENLADIKVAAAMAHVEALIANQQEAAKKYEAYSKAIEELKVAEEEALKAAEMAEAATSALEAELHRKRQEQEINQTPQLI